MSEQQVRALLQAGRPGAAEAAVRALLEAEGGTLERLRLLAAALRAQGLVEESRAIQEDLVEARPGDLALRFELAETLLLLGQFERGWREYRHRYGLAHTRPLERKVQRPRWDGQAIPGRTLLVHDEQGYGDTLQFMRLVPWARARSQAARLVFQVQEDLLPLARRLAGADLVIDRATLPPDFDFHCELMSLPMATGLTLEALPGPVPYAAAAPERVARWRRRLARYPRPLVALAWAGRPSHPNDANRSLRLEALAPLAAAGATFLAVQKGPAAAQASQPPPGMALVPLEAEIADFDDTAAILEIADLLVSVDSSPVHLAGALGRPAWVLLPLVPDWRWLLGRADTPWYPATRLFRQTALGDWSRPVAEVAAALGALPRPRA